jgi:hypothetical protein
MSAMSAWNGSASGNSAMRAQPAEGIGEPACVEDAQQHGEDLWHRFLDLVQQNHGERLAAEAFNQFARAAVIAAQQPLGRARTGVFAHVQAHQATGVLASNI